MAILLEVKNLLLAGLLSVLLLVAMQEAAQAEPVLASYYGGELAGNPTASGEPFDPFDMTAAHPYLPFGTLLTVSNSGWSVTVRVNDRGPYVAGRGLDLSLGAAQAIGITGSGAAVVEVGAAGIPAAKPAVPENETMESAEPRTRTIASVETGPSAGVEESGKRHVFVTVDTFTPPGKRVVDFLRKDFPLRPHELDEAHHETTSNSEGPLATRLAKGVQMVQTFYARFSFLCMAPER